MRFEANIATVPCVVDTDSLPAASVAFILEYGLKQYLQDGAAVSKLFLSGDRKGEAKSEDEIAEEKAEGVKERLQNLASGEFTRRNTAGPKATPEERERDNIIMARLQAAVKAMGKRLPTATGKNADPEYLAQLKAAYYAKNKAAIDKEVARRMKDANVVEDLSDLGL